MTLRKLSLTLAILLLLTGFPLAQVAASNDSYFGLKLSYFELVSPDIEESPFDDPDNVGLLLGYEKTFDYGYYGGEAEISRTFVTGTFSGQEVTVDTLGLFVVYRSRESSRGQNGPYLKLKAGPFYYRANTGGMSTQETTAAVGLGFGVNMSLVRFELEILAPEDDVGFVSMNILF